MQFNTRWVKDMNMQFTEKEIQRANMEVLRFTHKEMPVKIIMKYHFLPICHKLKNSDIAQCWQSYVGKVTSSKLRFEEV